MSVSKGQCIGGIRCVEDVKKRCRIDEDGCWRWRLSCGNELPRATINGRNVSVRRWVAEQCGPLQTGHVNVVAKCGKLDCVSPHCAVSKRGPAFIQWLTEQGRLHTPAHKLAVKEAVRRSARLNPHKAVAIAKRIRAGEDRGAVAAAFGITRSHANKVARAGTWAEFVRGVQ